MTLNIQIYTDDYKENSMSQRKSIKSVKISVALSTVQHHIDHYRFSKKGTIMGLIRGIKNLMIKRGKKNKTWKEKLKQNVVAMVIILPLMTIVLSFTVYGSHASQYLIDKNPQAKWAPWLQWRASRIYHLWGSNRGASEGYIKYYTNYRQKLTATQVMEAQFQEISCLNDGEQFITALEKAEEFITNYAHFAQSNNETFQKANKMCEALRFMDASKRVNNPWMWQN
jgi:hypothetical protein